MHRIRKVILQRNGARSCSVPLEKGVFIKRKKYILILLKNTRVNIDINTLLGNTDEWVNW